MRLLVFVTLFLFKFSYADNAWNEDIIAASQTAASESKYLFVFFYSEDQEVKNYLHQLAADTNVARVISKKFIPVQINIAKQDSIHWRSKFLIEELPALVAMTPDFQIYDKCTGFKPHMGEGSVVEFVESSKRKIRNFDSWSGYSKQLVLQDPQAIEVYLNVKDAKYPSEEMITAFWDTCKDYYSESAFKMMFYFGGNDNANQFFVDSFLEFKQKFGFGDSYKIKREIAKNRIRPFIKEKNRLAYLDALDKSKSLIYPFEHDRFEEEVREEWILENQMWNQYLTMMDKQRHAEPEKKFNVYQYGTVIENCEDKAILKTARDWLEEDMAKDNSLQNQVDYAKLLYKLKEKKEMIPAIEKAIANSIKAGQDASGLEAMLTQAKVGM